MKRETGMQYELFDTDTGNVIGTFATEREALDVVRRAIEAYGRTYADDIALGVRDERGYPKALVEGDSLVQRALASSSAI
jgi:hypothetical protein